MQRVDDDERGSLVVRFGLEVDAHLTEGPRILGVIATMLLDCFDQIRTLWKDG